MFTWYYRGRVVTLCSVLRLVVPLSQRATHRLRTSRCSARARKRTCPRVLSDLMGRTRLIPAVPTRSGHRNRLLGVTCHRLFGKSERELELRPPQSLTVPDAGRSVAAIVAVLLGQIATIDRYQSTVDLERRFRTVEPVDPAQEPTGQDSRHRSKESFTTSPRRYHCSLRWLPSSDGCPKVGSLTTSQGRHPARIGFVPFGNS